MKILVAYDGSRVADSALDDLKLAGSPDKAEAVVISVAEVWLPPEDIEAESENLKTNPNLEKLIEKYREKGKKELAEAETFARHAGERLQKMFPAWKVKTEATFGSPAWEILSRADVFQPDLIVVGSHGRNAVGRLFLGSVSQKILTEANCSVRVARGRIEVDPMPSRIVIGFDGSKGAQAAVQAVAARNWQKESEVRLITATNHIVPTAIGRFVPPITDWVEDELQIEREWIEKIAKGCLDLLRSRGLNATLHIYAGNPKTVLIEEAERWHADSIFVGANSFGSRVERFLLGSVSAATAARSHCSVEVVRRNE